MKLKPSDYKKLEKLTLQFNAKIGEYPKQGVNLPAYRDIDTLRAQIEKWGPNELRRQMASMQRFVDSPPEIYTTQQGVNITLWEKQEVDRAIARTNKKRLEELKRYEPNQYKGTMGAIEFNNLRPRKNRVEEILPKNWDKYAEGAIKQAYEPKRIKQAAYKANYLKAVLEEIGPGALYDYVSKQPASKISAGLYEDPFLAIGFIYDPFEREVRSRQIMEHWSMYMQQDRSQQAAGQITNLQLEG